MRELARDLTVNPATVVRAYRSLTELGVLEVRRGDGTYVATAPPPLSTGDRRARLVEAARPYATLALTLGAGSEEAAEALAAAFAQIEEDSR